MTTIYTYDNQGIYSGAAECDPFGPVPPGLLVAPPEMAGLQVAQAVNGEWVVLPEYPIQPSPPFDRHAAALQIDEAVAAIYGRFTRFQLEYTEREQQAQAFKDAGYTGPVPAMVAQFATPAGIQAQAATDLILAQAVNLRTAQAALSALRMRKYEVLRAQSDAQAQAATDAILQAIAAVGAQVS